MILLQGKKIPNHAYVPNLINVLVTPCPECKYQLKKLFPKYFKHNESLK